MMVSAPPRMSTAAKPMASAVRSAVTSSPVAGDGDGDDDGDGDEESDADADGDVSDGRVGAGGVHAMGLGLPWSSPSRVWSGGRVRRAVVSSSCPVAGS